MTPSICLNVLELVRDIPLQCQPHPVSAILDQHRRVIPEVVCQARAIGKARGGRLGCSTPLKSTCILTRTPGPAKQTGACPVAIGSIGTLAAVDTCTRRTCGAKRLFGASAGHFLAAGIANHAAALPYFAKLDRRISIIALFTRLDFVVTADGLVRNLLGIVI